MMFDPRHNDELPAIPSKRYFTIGEVSELCAVKPHVLRYWEQEFPQLSPVKRRGNRRYYQREDVELVRTIRSLLVFSGVHHRWRTPAIKQRAQRALAGGSTGRYSREPERSGKSPTLLSSV